MGTASDSDSLAPFVPLLTAELADGTTGPVHRSIEGSLLSADISGFTALSERLAAEGRIGSERLAGLINDCFDAMIGLAYDHGAEILKFGGDALLMLFRGDDHARRAGTAGVGLHAALASTDAAAEASLTMTVGIAAGPFDMFLVGESTRELLVMGRNATRTIELESAAEHGETVVDDATAAACGAATGEARASGVVLLESPDAPPVGPVPRDHLPDDLHAFIPESITSQLAAVRGFGGEHRLASIVFAMLTGTDERIAADPDAVARDLHDLSIRLHAAADDAGVTVIDTDIAADGAKYLLAAGAPISTGHDEDAALVVATTLARLDTSLPLRVGASRGRVFATFLGTPYRRCYTTMGDPTNTAARMLGPAEPGQVIATSALVDATRADFVSMPLDPVHVKGKAEPLAIQRVIEPTANLRTAMFTSRIVGRDEEIAILKEVSEQPGGIVQLVGEAGSGKSRILTELYNHAYVRGLTTFTGACTPLGASTPYGVFRPLLRRGVGIDVDADPAMTGDLLAKIVDEEVPDMRPWLPLLAVPFGAEVAPTPESDAIDDEFRRDRIHDAVVEFIAELMLDDPALFVVEDAHWIDDATSALLSRLAAPQPEDSSWSICVTSRHDVAATLPALSGARSLRLGPLGDEAIRTIAMSATTAPLSDTALEEIVARSGGLALFAEQLGALAGSGRPLDELPESVDQLIVERIDQLDPNARAALRTAAVFGRSTATTDLLAVLGDQPVHAEALTGLNGVLFESEPGIVTFVHDLYRQSAYDALPFDERRNLHSKIGAHLETASDDPLQISNELARHFSVAGDVDRTWRYGLAAADAAVDADAWADAASWLHLALKSPTPPEHDRTSVWQRRGQALMNAGRFTEAAASFREALTEDADGERVALLHLGAAQAQTHLADYDSALSHVDDADKLSNSAEVGCEANLIRARISYWRGKNREAFDFARRALGVGNNSIEPPLRIAAAAHRVAAAAGEPLGFGDVEMHASAALDLCQRLGDIPGEAQMLNNLGVSAYFSSKRKEAADLYRRALELDERCGNTASAARSRVNLAELLIEQGEPHDAAELLESAIRNFRAASVDVGVAFCRALEGRLLVLQGDAHRAADALEEVASEYRSLEAPGRAAEVLIYAAEAALIADDPDRCERWLRQAREEVSAEPDSIDEGAERAQARLGYVTGALAMRRSGIPEALTHWTEARAFAQAASDDVLELIGDIMLAVRQRERRRLAGQLDELGISRVPLLDFLGFAGQPPPPPGAQLS